MGILSKHRVICDVPGHASIAMPDVQARRDAIQIPNGGLLHTYVNLYFNPRNAMMYKRRNEAQNICVLVISDDVLKIPEVVISDMNAAAAWARFFTADRLGQLDFDLIYSKDWNHPNPEEKDVHKKQMCAEVLIPESLSFKYVQGAYVIDAESQALLKNVGFSSEKITIKPYIFFS